MKKPKPFDKLKAEWYAKLKRSGFEDIENERGELKHYSSSSFFQDHHQYDIMTHSTKEELKLLAIEASSTYYRMASQFLQEHEFPSKRIKRLWEMHSEGVSAANISKALSKESGYKPLTPRKVRSMIDKLKAIMFGKI